MTEMVLVPKEPTEAMQNAMVNEMGLGAHEGEAIAIYKAALEAAPSSPVAGWQPIETAPKDGTIFLAIVFGSPQFVAWVEDVKHTQRDTLPVAGFMGLLKVERRTVTQESGFRVLMPPARGCGFGIHGNFAPIEPTHWMPLPQPPALLSTGEANQGDAG